PQKDLPPADIGPAGRKGSVVGRVAVTRSNAHVGLVWAHMAFRRFPPERRTPSPPGRRWPHRASGRTPVLPDGLWAPDEGSAGSTIKRARPRAFNPRIEQTPKPYGGHPHPSDFARHLLPRGEGGRRPSPRVSSFGDLTILSGASPAHHLNK